MKTIFSFAIFFVLSAVARSECPTDWVQNGQSCYYFSQHYDVKLPWHEAQSKCQFHLANLVVIHDAAENKFLHEKLKDEAGIIQQGNFIGLHDLQEEDKWQWVDGSDLDYTNWEHGQPDNNEVGAGGSEDCVELYDGRAGTWNDQSCTYKRYFICERDVSVVSSPNCNELDSWYELDGRCYKYFEDETSWNEANKVCQAANSNLVSITSQAEQNYVANQANSKNQNVWIGLSSVNHETNALYWSNGNDQYSEGTSFNNWLDNQPQLSSQSTNCVEVQPSASLDGPWNVDRCGNAKGFMCESSFTGTCAPGWRLFENRCYFIAESTDLFLNWPEANAFCKGTGGSLLMIDGNGEAEYIQSRLPVLSDAGANGLWLGVSDIETDGVFKWVNGQLNDDVQYVKWATNQPYSRDGAWDCGQIYTGAASGIWETTDCYAKQAFICEIDTGVDVKQPDPIAQLHEGCDPDWIWFNGYCYYYEYTALMPWQQAEDSCVGMGGHLASILSGEENAFVSGHASDSCWIGLNDQTTSNNFQWTDNSPYSYNDFVSGEPNDSGDCVQFWADNNYGWDDAACTKTKPFVCKKPEQDCSQQLGMQDYTIPDGQITASSIYNEEFQPYFGRIHNQPTAGSRGCWSPATNANEYLQIKLNDKQTVAGITTQGRPADNQQYVKTYYVSLSDDGQSFTDVVDSSGTRKIFQANFDHITPITNRLPSPTVTSYVRIYPLEFYGYPSMRAEVIGCSSSGGDIPTAPTDSACWSVPIGERLDCGYYGIQDQECVSKGCCWDTTVPDAPWCFYKKDDYDPRCGSPGWIYEPAGSFFCYHFNEFVYRSWDNARKYCHEAGGELISIHSKEEDAWITAHIADKRLTHSFWLGANDKEENSGWKWSDGTAFQYFNWANGEPNDFGDGEDCAELYISDANWNDVPCSSELAVMCKKFSPTFIPSLPDADANFNINICEGNSKEVLCPPNTLIIIHHAKYGRSSSTTCADEEQEIPPGGCLAEDEYDIVAKMCDYKEVCLIWATNEFFGDPCPNVYKYLNVIYSCEYDDCYVGIGIEDSTIGDDHITQSGSTDGSHQGSNGRLNGPSSWATNEQSGAYVQVNLDSNMQISGVITQGANDQNKWVTKFKVGFPDPSDPTNYLMYQDYDGNEVEFIGNTDQQTTVRNPFPEKLLSNSIRIYPTEWSGGIAMRFEVTGCVAADQANCQTTFDDYIDRNAAEGESHQVQCVGGCPGFSLPKVWGTDIYAGKSEVCSTAIHAGYLKLMQGGPVTIIHQKGQSSYVGSDRNYIRSKDLGFYESSFNFGGNKEACPHGWTPYRSLCFKLITDAPLGWDAASKSCQSMGGFLASIEDDTYQEVIHQIIQKSNFGEAWIGLNDKRQYNQYEWSDGAPVFFTNWEPNEPNNFEDSEERCVEMYKGSGKWNDQDCSDIQDYVCVIKKDYLPKEDTDPPVPPEGCDEGWEANGASCYLLDRTRRSEADSEDFCKEVGGYNIHIKDNLEQSYIHILIGAEDSRWWLGIHADQDEADPTSVTWHWEDGDPLKYSNWGYGQPTIDAGKCAVFFGGPVGYGLWFSASCDENKSYSICEKQRVGFTPPPATQPPPKQGCLGDWATPNDDDPFCYKVFMNTEEDPSSIKQIWNNAKHQCMGYNADLVSIHSKTEETYILSQLLKLELYSQPIWIGLNKVGDYGWEWSDGTSTDFLNWAEGFPTDAASNLCGAFLYDTDQGTGKWQNLHCNERFDFICKHSKYDYPATPASFPSGQPNPQCGSSEDGTWLQYNNLCYLFADTLVDSYTATETCNKVGGELVSIHSLDEQGFITGQINQMGNVDRYWIGLSETGALKGEYTWSDGTLLDYVYWNMGEPNDAGGMEQCVHVFMGTGKWNDANCGLQGHAGFICKKYLGNPPIPSTTPAPPIGGCGEGWFIYGDYCYKLHGNLKDCNSTVDSTACVAGFQDAQSECTKEEGALTSIHDKYENAFLAAHTLHAVHDTWIGLNDIQWWKNYVWANGEKVDYVNWADGEPNKSEIDDENNREECAQMYRGADVVGRWNDNNCGNLYSYYCKKNQDPSIKVGKEINNNKRCKDGWMQYELLDGDFVCFYFSTEQQSFDGATKACRDKGGELASLQSEHEQQYVTSLVKNTPAWIGLKLGASQSYEWVDGWPVWMTNWGEFMPSADPSQGCVLNKDGAIGSEWISANCEEQHAYLCKTTSQSVPTDPPYVEGYCRNPTWHVFGAFCYFYNLPVGNEENEPGLNWAEAEAHCNREGGNLVSFAERDELEWLQTWYNNTEHVWIGLNENGNEGWAWSSGRPVTFTNWNAGEPNDVGEAGEDCVEMFGDRGMWNDNACDKKMGYICRVPKIYKDDNGNTIYVTTPANIQPEDESSSNVGIIIGIIIGIILVIVGIALAVKFCSCSGTPVSKLTEGASGFVNQLYTGSSGDKTASSDPQSTTIRFEPNMHSET